MAKTTTYRQCHLVKKRKAPDAGELHQTSWIPSQFAVMNKVLKLKDEDGAWDNGWVVTSVGPYEKTEKEANEGTQLHKKQRRASDI